MFKPKLPNMSGGGMGMKSLMPSSSILGKAKKNPVPVRLNRPKLKIRNVK